TATDACDDDPLVMLIAETQPGIGCSYTIVRTFQASDACGNTSICTQVITVEDNTAPSLTCPEDFAITCPEKTCLTFDDFVVGPDTAVIITEITQGGVTVGITAWSKGGEQRDAALFNTSDPHPGCEDLGTPNVLYGGPGVSSEDPNGYETTNNRSLGNVVIVQNPGFGFPDDYFLSDSVVFQFSDPVFVERLVAVDFEI